jgi:polysaccharide pyruvyl transferase CsaB
MKTQPDIVICGNYGASNLGDEAILESIIHTVRSVSPCARIIVLSSNPVETAHTHDVKSVPLIPAGVRSFFRNLFGPGLRETIKAIKNCDVYIFGGGGLFTDEKPYAMFIWSIQVFAAFLFRKPVFCYGQSIGPLMSFWSRRRVRKIFRRMDFISVRDDASKKILENLSIKNIRRLPDPAFSLHVMQKGNAPRENFVAFSIRQWGDNEALLHELAKFINWLHDEHRINSVLIPFQSRSDNDSVPLGKILSHVWYPNFVRLEPYTSNYHQVMDVFLRARAVVGMRLHSIIFSALAATPFIALSYSRKVAEVSGQLGMDDFTVPYREISFPVLKAKFEKMLLHEKELKKMITFRCDSLKHEATEYRGCLKDFLSSLND